MISTTESCCPDKVKQTLKRFMHKPKLTADGKAIYLAIPNPKLRLTPEVKKEVEVKNMSWNLNVKAKKEKPKGELVDNQCRLWINGSLKSTGSYNVSKNDTIKCRARVKNTGGKGTIYAIIYDVDNGEQLKEDHKTKPNGGRFDVTYTFKISKSRKIKYLSGHWTGSKWVQDDSYGD